MPKGRPSGLLVHAEAFEALVAARGLFKKDVADEAGLSAGFVADLLAHRSGASRPTAERIASALGVTLAAIFPEAVGWVGPLPDRDAKRGAA
jgi:transcriptional regulator with XRE-family HTH domain